MRRRTLNILLVAAVLAVAWPASGQTPPAAAAAGPPDAPHHGGARTAAKIAVDGRLDEADWARAQPAKDFLQKDPDEGKPATEPTEVRFLYDDDALYVGARMFDSEPSKIAKRLTRRDGDTDGIADWIAVGIDAHHDKLTGSMFSVTAAGSIGDGVLFNDSSDDDTWNGVWDAAVSIDDKGWIAEMRIPFSQLRFSKAEQQLWGLHVVRMVQRKQEETWWALVPKNESRLVSLAGELDGLDGIVSRRHLELLPYVTARSEISGTAEPGDPFNDGRTAAGSIGLDAKWGFASNMTLDATVNPDFGQVEVDPAVVNLTVFETFYEERRPFFIEGSQAFDRFGRNGASGYMGFNRTNPTLFYSRRVGRTPQGAAAGEYVDRPTSTTILGAAKVTGKTSRGWTVNFIDAATAREYADTSTVGVQGKTQVEPLSNYLAARVRRDVGQRAGFGMLTTAVNRNLSDPALERPIAGSAFVLGGDGHLFLTGKRDYVVTGSFSGSRVAGSQASIARLQRSSARYYQRPDATHIAFDPAAESLSGWSLQSDFNKNSGGIRPNASFWAVSPGFEVNDAGLHDERRPDGRARGAGVPQAHAGPLQPRPVAVRGEVEHVELRGRRDGRRVLRAVLRPAPQLLVHQRRAHAGRWVYSDRLTRGGPMMRAPGFTAASASIEGDERKPVVWEVDGDYETRPDGSWSGRSRSRIDVQAAAHVQHRSGPDVHARAHRVAVRARGDRRRGGRDVRPALRVRGAGPDGVRDGDAAQPHPEPAHVAADVPAAAALERPVHTGSRRRCSRGPTTSPSTAGTPARSASTRRTASTRSIPGPAAPARRSSSRIRTSTTRRCARTRSSAGSSSLAPRSTSSGRSSARTRQATGASPSTRTSPG